MAVEEKSFAFLNFHVAAQGGREQRRLDEKVLPSTPKFEGLSSGVARQQVPAWSALLRTQAGNFFLPRCRLCHSFNGISFSFCIFAKGETSNILCSSSVKRANAKMLESALGKKKSMRFFDQRLKIAQLGLAMRHRRQNSIFTFPDLNNKGKAFVELFSFAVKVSNK